MKKNRAANIIIFVVLLILATVGMFLADQIQQGFLGNVKVTNGVISTEYGDLTYKLYTPASATKENPAPGVLLLHGYQNDHETCAAYAIELARRGAVVLSLDEYGHGASEPGLLSRGYVNHKVTVNYGNDSEAEGTFKVMSPGGQIRYKIMMNFSNLSFFNEHYTKDEQGNVLTDSSCGGIFAYAVLASMDNVDQERLGLSGHSMGTWSSWSVAAYYSGMKDEEGKDITPKATVLQCGELFRDSVYDTEKIYFNNVLLLQAKYDEFSYFRDYKLNVTDELLRTPLRLEFLKTTADKADWNTTFGSFEDGTARRMELLYTNHRLTTHNEQGLTVALDWFDQALKLPNPLESEGIIAPEKESLTLGAMLLVLIAMLPLMEFLLSLKPFENIRQPLPGDATLKSRGAIVRGALITILISAATFPFMTQLGHGLLPLPENIFRMTVGNGFVSWYGLLIIIMLITTLISAHGAKKRGSKLTGYEMGLARPGTNKIISWGLLFKSLILVTILVGMVYLVNWAYTAIFNLDLRYIWPFFRVFTGMRFLQFLVYILVFLVFYIMNNSKIMAGMRIKSDSEPGPKGFIISWLKNMIVMAGGLLIITLIEYVPFFLGIGVGADMLFGSTFGGPFMSLLILFVPQVIFYSFICTYCYRRTGNVYTGAMIAAFLSCWIVTGGSAFL